MARVSTKEIIHVILFAPQREGTGFEQALRGLGYRVEVTWGRDWLSLGHASPVCPRLLFFGENCYPKDRLLTALPDCAASFGVFHGIPWDKDVLSRCTDVSTWPCDLSEFAFRLQRFLQQTKTVLPAAAADPDPLYEFARLNMIGRSPAFLNALNLTRKIARCEAPVLIEGETGTGKELIARAIHYLGSRRDFPFIPVNCGAIPENLVENELFGHERGAFTDAKDAQPGLISQAHGGTLFLDEMEALPARGQVALLRFLQDRQYRPLGGKRTVSADVRIISASNADLAKMADARQFREDLLFRLNIMSVGLPPLRERPSDVPLLAAYFIERFSNQYGRRVKSLHPDTLAWLNRYDWPGNVRELENIIHRHYLLTDGPIISIPRCPQTGAPPRAVCFNEAKSQAIADFEKAFLTSVLADAKGNVTLAAKRAGKERRAFGKLLKKYAIDREQFQRTPLSD